MFSILQKPQDNVNAEDLETLQNEIESRLVSVVTERWRLERELEALNNLSPDTGSHPALPTTGNDGAANSLKHNLSSSQPNASLPSGKLRNSLKQSQIDSQIENASDGFKGSIFTNGNNNGASGGSASGANSNETDSVSSEGSITSNLTGSTIITANLAELAAQNSNLKRGLKNSSTSDRPSKRFRPNSSSSLQSTGAYPKRPPHSKHRTKIIPSKFRNSTEESRPNKKQIVRNEAPDKLWPFVEQFCATPTEDQMKVIISRMAVDITKTQTLEEMINSMEHDKEYYRVPATLKSKDSALTDSVKEESSTNHGGNNSKSAKKSRQKNVDDVSLGALTQRVVSSLMEEVDDNGTDASKSSSEASPPGTKKRKSKGNKGIDADNAKNIEEKIRQQLEEYSILTKHDDIPYTSEEDEILRELLVYQHELLSIQTQNRHSMQILLKKAKKHSELEKEREKLQEANSDVIDAYHRLIQAKQRKRNPTKKEKEAAWKALKVHDNIYKKCDELYMTSLERNNV